jgi:hypothetical protein
MVQGHQIHREISQDKEKSRNIRFRTQRTLILEWSDAQYKIKLYKDGQGGQ